MEMTGYASRYVISDATGAGEVRRAAAQLASRLNFSETDSGRLALAATELAQNIFAHAGSGEVFLRGVGTDTVELLAIDKGPGMANVSECMRDGYSTAGTQGMGLGMLTRTASNFDLYTRVGQGTIIWLELRASDAAASPVSQRPMVTYGVVNAPHPGERVSGDSWSVSWANNRWRALVVDGLGHGAFAKDAADEAVRIFEQNADQSSMEIIHRLHAALRKTRGAAAAVLSFDSSRSEATLVGVGNVAVTLVHEGKTRSMVSHNGTLGVETRRVQEFVYPWLPQTLMVMFSDGLISHWKLDAYPGLLQRHPSVIAAVLYRDFKRGRDDVTVLCARRVPMN
jgi:anti-sigma regulatory factor (Ser/Thr protein kinase)